MKRERERERERDRELAPSGRPCQEPQNIKMHDVSDEERRIEDELEDNGERDAAVRGRDGGERRGGFVGERMDEVDEDLFTIGDEASLYRLAAKNNVQACRASMSVSEDSEVDGDFDDLHGVSIFGGHGMSVFRGRRSLPHHIPLPMDMLRHLLTQQQQVQEDESGAAGGEGEGRGGGGAASSTTLTACPQQ